MLLRTACDLLIEWRWKQTKIVYIYLFKKTKNKIKTAAQTREARDRGCGEHRPPRRRLGGRSQASLRPCKLSFFFNDVPLLLSLLLNVIDWQIPLKITPPLFLSSSFIP